MNLTQCRITNGSSILMLLRMPNSYDDDLVSVVQAKFYKTTWTQWVNDNFMDIKQKMSKDNNNNGVRMGSYHLINSVTNNILSTNELLGNTSITKLNDYQLVDIGNIDVMAGVYSKYLLYQATPAWIDSLTRKRSKLSALIRPILYQFYSFKRMQQFREIKRKQKENEEDDNDDMFDYFIFMESETHNDINKIIKNASWDRSDWKGIISQDTVNDDDISIQIVWMNWSQFILYAQNKQFNDQFVTAITNNPQLRQQLKPPNKQGMDVISYIDVMCPCVDLLNGGLRCGPQKKCMGYSFDLKDEADAFQKILENNNLSDCDGLSIYLRKKEVYAINLNHKHQIKNSSEKEDYLNRLLVYGYVRMEIIDKHYKYKNNMIIADFIYNLMCQYYDNKQDQFDDKPAADLFNQEIVDALYNNKNDNADSQSLTLEDNCTVVNLIHGAMTFGNFPYDKYQHVLYPNIDINASNIYYYRAKLLALLTPILYPFYALNKIAGDESDDGYIFIESSTNKNLSSVFKNESLHPSKWNGKISDVIRDRDQDIKLQIIYLKTKEQFIYYCQHRSYDSNECLSAIKSINKMSVKTTQSVQTMNDDDGIFELLGTRPPVMFGISTQKVNKNDNMPIITHFTNYMETSITPKIDEYHGDIKDESEKFKTFLAENNVKDCKCLCINLTKQFVYTINIK